MSFNPTSPPLGGSFLPHSLRNYSNKENSSTGLFSLSSTSSTNAKPRLGGVGRAPRFRGPRKHSMSMNKPYDRKGSMNRSKLRSTSNSIQRAKLRSNAEDGLKKAMKQSVRTGGDMSLVEEEGEDVDMGETAKRTFRLLLVSAPQHPSLPLKMNKLSPTQLRSSPMARSTSSPLPMSGARSTYPSKARILGRVPIQLPPILKRPMIPPVLHDETGDCAVPIDYVLQRISPYFNTIYDLLPHFVEADTSLRLKPQRSLTPVYSTASGPVKRLDDEYDTLPFWIGESIPYAGLNEEAKKKCFHWGPDACLVVRQKGVPGSQGSFFPIKKLVLSSQCANFDKLIEQGEAVRGSAESTTTPASISKAPVQALPAAENEARRRLLELKTKSSLQLSNERSTSSRLPLSPLRRTFSSHSRSSSASSTATVVCDTHMDKENSPDGFEAPPPTSTSKPPPPHPMFVLPTPSHSYPPPRPPKVGPEAYATRQLDLLPIYLPDTKTFPLVLLSLHFPDQSPLRHLLDLDHSPDTFRAEIIEYLRCFPLAQLEERMNRVLGFYANVIELGISNGVVWQAISQAWGLVYIARQRRMWVHPPMVERYDQRLPPVIQWRTVLGLPGKSGATKAS